MSLNLFWYVSPWVSCPLSRFRGDLEFGLARQPQGETDFKQGYNLFCRSSDRLLTLFLKSSFWASFCVRKQNVLTAALPCLVFRANSSALHWKIPHRDAFLPENTRTLEPHLTDKKWLKDLSRLSIGTSWEHASLSLNKRISRSFDEYFAHSHLFFFLWCPTRVCRDDAAYEIYNSL